MDIVICDTAEAPQQAEPDERAVKNQAGWLREPPDDFEIPLVLMPPRANGLIQAKQFSDTAGITGIVLTKLDGTAKGGIIFAICDELKIPVKYVGVGEKADDLLPFNPQEFVEALLQ